MWIADNSAILWTGPLRGTAQSRLRDGTGPHPSRRRTDGRPGARPGDAAGEGAR